MTTRAPSQRTEGWEEGLAEAYMQMMQGLLDVVQDKGLPREPFRALFEGKHSPTTARAFIREALNMLLEQSHGR